MKKLLITVMAMMALAGCKKCDCTPGTSTTAKPANADKETCLDLKVYYTLKTTPEKVEWLSNYGSAVCDDVLYPAVEESHIIKNPQSVTRTPGAPIGKTWAEMKDIIGNNHYNKYVGFIINPTTHDIEDVVLIPKYTSNPVCYSIAFFRSIDYTYTLKDDDEFEFANSDVITDPTKAAVATVAIKVKSNYYDFSDEPKKRAGMYDENPL